jgi:hypothetical protein
MLNKPGKELLKLIESFSFPKRRFSGGEKNVTKFSNGDVGTKLAILDGETDLDDALRCCQRC